jgi:hypothetical protein
MKRESDGRLVKIVGDILQNAHDLAEWGLETKTLTEDDLRMIVLQREPRLRREAAIKLIEGGVSQRQAAKLLGVDHRTIQRDVAQGAPPAAPPPRLSGLRQQQNQRQRASSPHPQPPRSTASSMPIRHGTMERTRSRITRLSSAIIMRSVRPGVVSPSLSSSSPQPVCLPDHSVALGDALPLRPRHPLTTSLLALVRWWHQPRGAHIRSGLPLDRLVAPCLAWSASRHRASVGFYRGRHLF